MHGGQGSKEKGSAVSGDLMVLRTVLVSLDAGDLGEQKRDNGVQMVWQRHT